MQKVCRRYAVQKTLLLVHIWYSHTLSLFQTNIKPLNPNEKTLNTLLKQFSRHRQLLFCAAHFFGYFHLRRHTVVPEKTPYIHAHSAKPILNQNNQTKLTRYVSLSRVPLLLYTVAYGNSIPEETNARFGRLWKFVLPEVRSSHRRRFVASTSCHLLIFFARNFVKFVKRVYSRGPCVRGGCGSAGGAEGRYLRNTRNHERERATKNRRRYSPE